MGDRCAPWRAAVRLLLGAALALVLLGLALDDVTRWRHDRRGIESGASDRLAPIMQPRYGTNVALEQYADDEALQRALQQARALGLEVLRQRLPWEQIELQPGAYDWAQWDRVVTATQAADLPLILVLDTSPTWARWEWDADNPLAPAARDEDYARFVSAAAERYRGRVLAYQIWDNPNVSPHWGKAEINPGAYVAMLRLASEAVRVADPDALVLAGGMAPNTETRGRNMSDVLFVREMCRLGATSYYDALAVKAFGFWSGPYDRRVSPGVLNWSRLILIRQELHRLGGAGKAIWAVEGGWAALPDGWAGAPSPVGSDAAELQAARLAQALERADQEWPWLGLVCVQHLQPAAEADDPLWGLALLSQTGAPTALAEAFHARWAADGHLGAGRYQAQTVLASSGALERPTLALYGTSLRVTTSPAAQGIALQVSDSISNEARRVTLAKDGRPTTLVKADRPTTIHVSLRGSPEALGALETITVTHTRRWHHGWASLLAAVVGLVLLGVWAAPDLALVPWRQGWAALQRRYRVLPRWAPAATMGVLAALALWGPSSAVRAAALLAYGALALLDADRALDAAVVALFVAPLNVRISRWQFSAAELAILVATLAHAWDLLVRGGWRASLVHLWHRKSLLDLAVALYVVLGMVGALRAVYQREALRELRLVFIEPALLYALLRWRLPDRHSVARLLLGAGVGLSLYALAGYATPAGVIVAEGARRARAFFGSPNNLALLLERIAPLGLALTLAATGRRRTAMAIATGLMLLVIALTFSRGAWVLGVPAGLLVVLLLHGPRTRRFAAIAVVCGALLLLPLSRVPRLAALTDLSSGTPFLRLQLWRSAWHMARDHALWGVGPDNFLYHYGDYILPEAMVDRWLSHPHNIALDFWLRLGLLGLPLSAFWAWSAVRAITAAVQRSDPQRSAAIGLAGGLAAMLAHGLVDSSLFVVELAGWFMVSLALLQRPRTR